MTDEKPIKYIWTCAQQPNWLTDEEMERKTLYYENKYTLIEKHSRCKQPKFLCGCDAENYEVTFKIQDADMATFYYTTDAPSGLSDEEIVTYVWDDRYEIKDDWFYLPYDWDGVGEHYYAKIISKTTKIELD